MAPVFVDGHKTVTLKGDTIAQDFERIVTDYVKMTYGGEAPTPQLKPERRSIGIRAV